MNEGRTVQLSLGQQALCRFVREMFAVQNALIVPADGREPQSAVIGDVCHRAAASGEMEILGPETPALARAAIRFCVAVPLTCSTPSPPEPAIGAAAVAVSGARRTLGTLVLTDTREHTLSEEQVRQLAELADIACALLATEAELREASALAARYRILADNSTDTLVRGDLNGVRLYISPAVRSLLGYEPDELVGRRAAELVHPDDLPEFAVLMQQIREGRIERGRSEQRQRHKNGHWVWLEAFLRLTRDKETGIADGYVVSARDISHRKAAEERLAHLAAHDALTGLANRNLLQQRLGEELARARRGATGFAVLCLDLDGFKAVNDTHGHAAGDEVLRAVAARLKRANREEDLVARLGGDEFIILIGANPEPKLAAERLAARLLQLMARPITYHGREVKVGVSIGIAVAEPDMVAGGVDLDGLLRQGDRALYQAKEDGRNRFVTASGAPPRGDTAPRSGEPS